MAMSEIHACAAPVSVPSSLPGRYSTRTSYILQCATMRLPVISVHVCLNMHCREHGKLARRRLADMHATGSYRVGSTHISWMLRVWLPPPTLEHTPDQPSRTHPRRDASRCVLAHARAPPVLRLPPHPALGAAHEHQLARLGVRTQAHALSRMECVQERSSPVNMGA